MIREGLRRAPNAMYSLVQSVLVQDEALKAANNRIQDYEQQFGGPEQQQQGQPKGFLDNMRDSLFGGGEQRGSVPRVPQGGAPMGAPPGYQNDPWNRQQGTGSRRKARPTAGLSGRCASAPPQSGGGGGSFLGTAAAVAAGAIGGSLLMSGIKSAMAGHQGGGPASKAFEDFGGGGDDRSPWSGGSGGDLSRQAGLNDIGGSRGASGDAGESRRAGLFDSNDSGNDSDSDDSDDSGDDGFDGGDSEE